MSNKRDVWGLLLKRQDQWLSRAEIEFVGGPEAMRRLREVRSEAFSAGYEVQSRPGPGNSDEYRMVRLAPGVSPIRSTLRCVKCWNAPVGTVSPSVDPRWSLGRCVVCDRSDSIFASKTAYEQQTGMHAPVQDAPAPVAMPVPVDDEYAALDAALKSRQNALGSDH